MTRPQDELAKLTPDERRALLTRMLQQRDAAPADLMPCSYGQRSLWFMHQLAPESSVYNVTFAWRIRAALDAGAMRRAFQALVDRHETLRTTYESRDGEPCQRLHARMPVDFQACEVGVLGDEALHELLVHDARQPFNLVKGPILRARLFTLDPEDHVLLVCLHHIACDLWSVEIMLDELRACYRHETDPGAPWTPLPPPVARYADFVSWQRAMLGGVEGEAHWKYWKERLCGDLPRLEMPADRPRPPKQSFAGEGHLFTVPAPLRDRLRRLAVAEGTTLFTVFLAAFQALLSRYSGQPEVLIGSVSAGRSRREFERILGYFVNPVVFRGEMADDPSFRSLLQRTRTSVLAALDRQDFPFPLLVERLRVDRDPSRSPLCDAYFIWDKTRADAQRMEALPGSDDARVQMDWHGLSLESFPLAQIGTPSDLAMLIWELGDSISVNIGYSTDLFDRATIEGLGRHFMALLHAAVADPDRVISRMPLVLPAERDALLCAGLPMARFPRTAATLHGGFEAQARRRPEAVAITCEGRHVTYQELDALASGLAARLRAAGVIPGGMVGLYVERSVDAIVAILGILKAGGVYVPIDRSYPPERIEFMLQDADVSALVTQRALEHALSTGAVPRILVDEPGPGGDDVSLVETGTGEDVAYVIYTSGSTGRPKGVMVTHHNVLRLFEATAPWYAFDERDVWSLFHSLAFDFSVWELWGALLHGGRLVIVPHDVTRAPDEFLDLLLSEAVTVLNQTPSAFRQLMAADQTRGVVVPLSLRLVIFGGEMLDVPGLKPWFARRGDTQPRLVNMYGITETTVHVTYRPISVADLDGPVRSPIGRPIPDLRLLVLDADGEPVPPGVPGELYVGGAGVARGYLNRPELTRERFLPDRAAGDPSARLYRTGDLVRLRASGELEYLGRLDQQVKIRGFRVELGEIEAAIMRHPGVAQCAVILRTDLPGESRIVAYVVARHGVPPTASDLHQFVRNALPDYMTPSAFIMLDALPLTQHHKLDMRALPAPVGVETTSSRPFLAPRTAVEHEIADHWVRLLGVGRVGADDDFFELGGHSILATSLAGWVRERFQIEFPLYAVFEEPTVGGIARRIDAIHLAKQASGAAPEREELEF